MFPRLWPRQRRNRRTPIATRRRQRDLGFEQLEGRWLLSNGSAVPTIDVASSTSPGHAAGALSNANLSTASFWTPSAVPNVIDSGEGKPLNLGIKFTADTSGFITGIRFFKSPANNGLHVADLWTSNGRLLANINFTNETASGWQQANFLAPVPITAGTTYVASYFAPNGHFSVNRNFFDAPFNSGQLHAPIGAGVYGYAARAAFPSSTINSNYWVDVVFKNSATTNDLTPPTVLDFDPDGNASNVPTNAALTVTFSEALDPATVDSAAVFLSTAGSTVPATVVYLAATNQAIVTPTQPLNSATTYSLTVLGGPTGATDLAGNALAATATATFVTTAANAAGTSFFAPASVPSVIDSGEGKPLDLGIKFTSSTNGFITGVRFYKSAANTGVHYADLWSGNGQLLAHTMFTGETASGWQQVNFPAPVAITAGVTYTASYFTPSGHFSVNRNFFNAPLTSGPLHAPVGAGVYLYALRSAMPALSINSNYWVDVVFSAGG